MQHSIINYSHHVVHYIPRTYSITGNVYLLSPFTQFLRWFLLWAWEEICTHVPFHLGRIPLRARSRTPHLLDRSPGASASWSSVSVWWHVKVELDYYSLGLCPNPHALPAHTHAHRQRQSPAFCFEGNPISLYFTTEHPGNLSDTITTRRNKGIDRHQRSCMVKNPAGVWCSVPDNTF